MMPVLWDPDAFKRLDSCDIATPKVDHNVSKGNSWEGLDFDDTVLNVKDTKIFAETVIAENAVIDTISENSVSAKIALEREGKSLKLL